MTYNIAISNRVHEKLVALKGKGSYSAAIESIMNKAGIPVASPSEFAPKQKDHDNKNKQESEGV